MRRVNNPWMLVLVLLLAPAAINLVFWVLLRSFRGEDLPYLRAIEPWLKSLRWIFYITWFLWMTYVVIFDGYGEHRSIGILAVVMFNISIGLHWIQSWVRKRCGIEEQPNEYWPTKPVGR